MTDIVFLLTYGNNNKDQDTESRGGNNWLGDQGVGGQTRTKLHTCMYGNATMKSINVYN